MVVTVSLARGLLREAVERQSKGSRRAMGRLQEFGFAVPATMRGFRRWFEERAKLFQGHALLIVHGTTGRREGVFAAYLPVFIATAKGWELEVDRFAIRIAPDRLLDVTVARLPLRISGHALERTFQRAGTIEWTEVADCLGAALTFASLAAPAYANAGLRQCAVPAEKGLLVGAVKGGALQLRTFLPATDLSPRWAALHRDLVGAYRDRLSDFHAAAAVPSTNVPEALAAVLASPAHRWLREAYAEGLDRLAPAWAQAPGARQALAAAQRE